MNKKVKNIKKENNILFNILIILILLMIFGMVTNFNFAKRSYNTYSIVINANDTIWDIARDICNKDAKLNIQNVIIDIQEINNLSDTNIYVGQTLNVPIY